MVVTFIPVEFAIVALIVAEILIAHHFNTEIVLAHEAFLLLDGFIFKFV